MKQLPVLERTPSARANGAVLYRGPSMIDRQPIVALLTGLTRASRNPKTGTMLQTWILRADQSPLDALRSGADKSICGGCPHRPDRHALKEGKVKRSCYVRVNQAPTSIFKAFQAESYLTPLMMDLPALAAGRFVRLGSYGDPAAVPLPIWHALTRDALGWTGYTHQWRAAKFAGLKALCQASVDSDEERIKAKAEGWGTFHVRPAGDVSTARGQVLCPASAEAGKSVDCMTCRMCNGRSQKQIVIPAHGAGKLYITHPDLEEAAA